MKIFEPIRGYTVSEIELKNELEQPIDIKEYRQYIWELMGTAMATGKLMGEHGEQYGLSVTKACVIDTGYEVYKKLDNLIQQVSPESKVILEVDKDNCGYRESINIHVFIPSTLSGEKIANTVYAIGKFNANMGLPVSDLVALSKTDRAQQFIMTHSGCTDSLELNKHHVEIKPLSKVEYHSNSSGGLIDPNSWEDSTISDDELPIELQQMLNSWWAEGLCDCRCYLASTEKSGETMYGMLLTYEAGYEDNNTIFETTKWFQKQDENFYDNVVPRAILYREILSELPYALTVFIGKGTGPRRAHEVGVFIPYGLQRKDMFRVLYNVKVLTSAEKLDKEDIKEKIHSEELFQKFVAEFS